MSKLAVSSYEHGKPGWKNTFGRLRKTAAQCAHAPLSSTVSVRATKHKHERDFSLKAQNLTYV